MSRKGVIHYIFADKANKGNSNYMLFLVKLLLEQEKVAISVLRAYLMKSL
jgi:hypothetical protein